MENPPNRPPKAPLFAHKRAAAAVEGHALPKTLGELPLSGLRVWKADNSALETKSSKPELEPRGVAECLFSLVLLKVIFLFGPF